MTRRRGYAVEEGEQEVGVRCFGAAIPDSSAMLAVSVSGPLSRMTEAAEARIAPALQRIGDEIAASIAAEGTA